MVAPNFNSGRITQNEPPALLPAPDADITCDAQVEIVLAEDAILNGYPRASDDVRQLVLNRSKLHLLSAQREIPASPDDPVFQQLERARNLFTLNKLEHQLRCGEQLGSQNFEELFAKAMIGRDPALIDNLRVRFAPLRQVLERGAE